MNFSNQFKISLGTSRYELNTSMTYFQLIPLGESWVPEKDESLNSCQSFSWFKQERYGLQSTMEMTKWAGATEGKSTGKTWRSCTKHPARVPVPGLLKLGQPLCESPTVKGRGFSADSGQGNGHLLIGCNLWALRSLSMPSPHSFPISLPMLYFHN